jgi:uncharacterized membrane protein required for colicin V production
MRLLGFVFDVVLGAVLIVIICLFLLFDLIAEALWKLKSALTALKR